MSPATLSLETQDAQKRWQAFCRDLQFRDRNLPKEDAADTLAEITAHVHDALAHAEGASELDRLNACLTAFGPIPAAPPTWRKPLAVMLHYLAIMVIGVTGLFLITLLHMGVMDIFNPDGVGLWVYANGEFSLSYEIQADAEEVAGVWFLPAILGVTAAISGLLFVLYRIAIAPQGRIAQWTRE